MLAAVIVVCVMIVFWLESLYFDGRAHGFDVSAHRWFTATREQAARDGSRVLVLMQQVTSLGGEAILFLVTVGGAILLSTVRRRALMWFWLGAIIFGRVLNVALKWITNHARPGEAKTFLELDRESFPSGHAMMSLIVFLMAAVLLLPHIPTRAGRIFAIAFAISLSFIVGLSRVYLGVHHASDVLAGWLLGGAWVALCWTMRDVILSRRQI